MALVSAQGTFSWNAADTVGTTKTVSGLPFQPKAIVVWALGSRFGPATSMAKSIGFAVSTSDRRCVGAFSKDVAGSADCGTAYRTDCVLVLVNGAGTVVGQLDLNAINSDGFQLIVDVQNTLGEELTTFGWVAWGGSDIVTAAIGEIAEPAATGTVDYTVTGSFRPDVVIFAGAQGTGAAPSSASQDSGFCVGFSDAYANNAVIVGNSDGGSATMDTDGYALSGECLAMITIAGGNPSARATLTQMNTDGFQLDWLARATTNRRNIYLAIKGGAWQVGNFTIDGATLDSTTDVHGLRFQPVGLLQVGACKTEATAGTSTTEDRMSVGVYGPLTGAQTELALGLWDQNAVGTSNTSNIATTTESFVIPGSSGGASHVVAANAIYQDGFQARVAVITGPGVANQWHGFCAWGSTAWLPRRTSFGTEMRLRR